MQCDVTQESNKTEKKWPMAFGAKKMAISRLNSVLYASVPSVDQQKGIFYKVHSFLGWQSFCERDHNKLCDLTMYKSTVMRSLLFFTTGFKKGGIPINASILCRRLRVAVI